MGTSQQFSLRWNNYLRHITNAFDSLRSDLDLVDVTLSCEGKKIKAHKMLLSACSTYFRDLFKENPCQHPVIIFRNVNFADLEALIDFMYQGEVNVVQEQLSSFLTTAELLAVQGLTDGNEKDLTEGLDDENTDQANQSIPEPATEVPVEKKRPNNSNSSFYSSSSNPVSPPTKRKKWSAPPVPVSNQKPRSDNSENRRQSRSTTESGGNSVEIIPVLSQVKVEIPEFLETDSGQPSFNSSGQELNPLESELSGLEHSIPSASGSKEESLDIYGGNSSDAGDITGEQMTPAELSQVLAKAGPSSEGSQDSLQAMAWNQLLPLTSPPRAISRNMEGRRRYPCPYCPKTFAHRISVALHMSCHQGKTVCPICRKVFSRAYNLKLHINTVHSDVQLSGEPPQQ